MELLDIIFCSKNAFFACIFLQFCYNPHIEIEPKKGKSPEKTKPKTDNRQQKGDTMRRMNTYKSTPHKQSVATLTNLPNGLMLRLDAAYSKEFLADLKASVPAKKRLWDKEGYFWYISKDQLPKLQLLCSQHYSETILKDFPAPEVAHSAWAALYLIPDTPLEVVQAAYRALAKRYHPDSSAADSHLMTTINAAYESIKNYYTTNGTEEKV